MAKTEASQLPSKSGPLFRIKWKRYIDKVNFKRPSTFLILGQRGTGKSSLGECIASQYPKVFDLFGSVDNESLAWCKPSSPFKRVLFLTSDKIKVTSRWDSMPANRVTLADIESHDAIVMCHAFFESQDAYFNTLQDTTEYLWRLRKSWTVPWFIIIREAANWIYARMQIVKDSQLAKAYFVMMLREARHGGLAVGVDTLRWTSLDKEVRDISDYIFIKRVGTVGLPRDLGFIYRYARPRSLMWMPPSKFVLLTAKGAIGFGAFRYPEWHKEESEDLIEQFDIQIERLAGAVEEKHRSNRMKPEEHYKLLKSYLETKSILKTAVAFNRSHATVYKVILEHNNRILKGVGFCDVCAEIDDLFSKQVVVKEE